MLLLHPVRAVRNRRANRRALARMTPLQRTIVKAFGVPPRIMGEDLKGRAEARAAQVQAEADYFAAVTGRPRDDNGRWTK